MPVAGKSIPHESAIGHVTGQAHYIDDLPRLKNELIADFFGSPVAHGKIKSLNLDKAARVPGIVGIYTHRDIGGENLFGPIMKDERFLAIDHVHFLHEPIAVVAGESQAAIEEAKKKIEIQMEELPPIFSIDEAIAQKSFIGTPIKVETGDTAEAFQNSKHIIDGVFESGGQEQFYLESQIAYALPQEGRELLIYSSTQNPTEIQKVAAEVLGLGHHEVVCVCKRMGGGFGGKETQGVHPALMAALVVQKTGRPTRCGYDKDTDMKVTGKRHPYKSFYKVGFNEEGLIDAVEINYYSDGGCSADLSPSVLSRTLMHSDNAYYLQNVKLTGHICKTNYPSNTAFRGFGGPQGVAAIENIIEEIAQYLKKDSYEIRKLNVYRDGRDTTPYGQVVKNNVLPELFEQLIQSSDYYERQETIKIANESSQTRLKAIAFTPVKFGISFTTKFLNQASALVNIYTDGTVQVSTGGTEMGQGLNTKIQQIVADEFGLPMNHVKVMITSTEKNNNASPTAASAGTDLNGNAALDACAKIRSRLSEFAAQILAGNANPGDQRPTGTGIQEQKPDIVFAESSVFSRSNPAKKISFAELVQRAHRERISLGERGFYATPGIDFNTQINRGSPFYYFTNGACVAEITIDRFTGALKIDRLDVLMDIGQSINPGIDRGQLIGGIVQGIGWATSEELRYAAKGELLSHSPTTYKIPNIQDIPDDFRLEFFDNKKHDFNVLRSKAVAEPPLMLGLAVFCAVKRALGTLTSGIPSLKLPATGEEILMKMQGLASQLNRSVNKT
ncbi:MAG: xanthine dehydrogenase molybdopterin binding subunit [Leptospirales bacterium]|nr:xanthine dehydrogenase molybdopterin binding subunit [Leptospirales bacterium]